MQAWRPVGSRLWGAIRFLLTSYVAVAVVLFAEGARRPSGALAALGIFAVVTLVGALLRPVLAGLAILVHWLVLLVLTIVAQAILLDVALALDTHADVVSHPSMLFASWLPAAVAGLINWALDSGDEDVFLDQMLGRAIRLAYKQRRTDHQGTTSCRVGLIVLQFDGVGENVLREAIAAGTMPTLSRWLERETHTLRGWHTGLPATTPAGQAVLLYGDVTEIPAFRWFEKESGRLMVANHPRDAAEIERRISNGNGLLANDGVSVSNLFSGDAPTRLLTMSDARIPPLEVRRFASFATTPSGLVRSLVMSAEQMITELYQGQRQRHLRVRPRVRRGVGFAVQRALTTSMIQEPSVAMVTDQIARGAPSIFVDLVNYDEVAHHAGPNRPDSMRTLSGFDRLTQYVADVVRETGRDFEIAIVSDHGQSQGATFAQTCGMALHDVVADLVADASPQGVVAQPVKISADFAPAERWGPANLLLTGVARSEGVAAQAITRTRTGDGPDAQVTVGPPRSHTPMTPPHEAALVIAAGGSLAHVYLPQVPGRTSREEIDNLYPRLVDGLAEHSQIGAVMVRSALLGSPVVVGATGWRILTPAGAVGGEGDDPVAVFGPHAAGDLFALDGRRHVGDLVVLGRFDAATGEVAAFEELVGSHGGLGGGQTEAVLLHPSAWSPPTGQILRGIDVHELLRDRVATRTRHANP